MNSSVLYERAAAELKAAQEVKSAAEKDQRDWTDEEQAKISAHCDAAERFRSQADAAKRLEATAQMVDAPHPGVPKDVGGQIPNFQRDHEPGPRSAAEPKDPTEEARFHFESLGHFALAAYNAQSGSRPDDRLTKYALDGGFDFRSAGSGMEQATGSLGGFLVPPAFSQDIWDGMEADDNNLLSLCDQHTVTGESLTFPAVDETSRADGYRAGGIRGYWKSEASQMTSSYPKLRQVSIEPQELYVFAYVTDKLLRNAGSLEGFLKKKASQELVFKIGDAIVNGTGAGQPLGILNSPCLVSVAKETSQAADTILAENVLKMRQRLHMNLWNRSVWLANQDTLDQLERLYIPVKNVGQTENVGGFPKPMFNGDAMTLLGRPVKFTEFSATVGDAGDLVLAAMGDYLAGVRGTVRSDLSIHLRFDYNETAFRFLTEVDGRPWLQSAITPYKGSNTLSAFIALDARA